MNENFGYHRNKNNGVRGVFFLSFPYIFGNIELFILQDMQGTKSNAKKFMIAKNRCVS